MQANKSPAKPTTTVGRGKNRGRYAKLRPYQGKIIQWCIEGIQWVDMAKSLAADGLEVSPASIQAGATRSGAVLIHPYSPHYDSEIQAAYLADCITHKDLKTRIQKK